MEIGARLEADSPNAFAAWLAAHGATEREIWVVVYKKASGKQTVTYEELVEVALCYGWIDGLRKSLDTERYTQRFAPRRKRSNWTETNRQLARRLAAEGRMTATGHAALPEDVRAAIEAGEVDGEDTMQNDGC
jgi:uncharacterized protein YdeI (YjbR/CyaY-like superfamily)